MSSRIALTHPHHPLLCSHGFGLPHTDENPYNTNLGNCLDYTDNPDENLYPGEVNFNKLAGMYLSENRRTTRRLARNGRIIETHMLVVDWDVVGINDEDLFD
jgi:hypothetical protein